MACRVVMDWTPVFSHKCNRVDKEKERVRLLKALFFWYCIVTYRHYGRNAMAYTKLFSSIITSTVWGESDRTRIVWITMLALADKNGEVMATVPGLSRLACVPVDDCLVALQKFMSPDAFSRTPDDQGRRIEEVPGGWHLLNHDKYRAMASKEENRQANADRQKRHRERKKRNGKPTQESNAPVTQSHVLVTHGRDIAEEEAEAPTDSSLPNGREEEERLSWKSARRVAPSSSSLGESEWLEELSKDPSYQGINIAMEHRAYAAYSLKKNKTPSCESFRRWLKRVGVPLSAPAWKAPDRGF